MLRSGTFFFLICVSNFLLAASVSLSISLPVLWLLHVLCLAKSVMKETYWSACWKDGGNKVFIAVLLLAFQKIKFFKEEDTQIHSFSCVWFSLIEWLEHDVFYCERPAKYCISSLSHKEYYFCKDRFWKCIGCILIDGI